jgi:hypothetical protein
MVCPGPPCTRASLTGDFCRRLRSRRRVSEKRRARRASCLYRLLALCRAMDTWARKRGVAGRRLGLFPLTTFLTDSVPLSPSRTLSLHGYMGTEEGRSTEAASRLLSTHDVLTDSVPLSPSRTLSLHGYMGTEEGRSEAASRPLSTHDVTTDSVPARHSSVPDRRLLSSPALSSTRVRKAQGSADSAPAADCVMTNDEPPQSSRLARMFRATSPWRNSRSHHSRWLA